VAHHNEECELDQSEGIMEQGALFQVSVLEEDVSERLRCLDLFLLNQAVANTNDRLLHFFGQINAIHQKFHVILFKVQSIICDPEVVKQAVVNIGDTSADLILLTILLLLLFVVGVTILGISLLHL
jgi:hypothetical protein